MTPLTVLVVGATGSIGAHVVTEALAAGHRVRALVRSAAKAGTLPAGAEAVIGDVTRPSTLVAAVEGIDAVVLTLGSDGQGATGARTIDYEGVRNVLAALDGRPVRVALMTAIGVTNREGSYNRSTQAHDWKRRSERLVRASGCEYTIVRPGWFDDNDAGQDRLVFLQGDRRQAGTPADGVVARSGIARVLVSALTSDAARHKTLELVSEDGPAQADLDPAFAALAADPSGALDAVSDAPNMPLTEEPAEVRADLAAISVR
ncbi:MAG: SDR family oxidoreductase [Propionicimonas sp.]|uniref:SDR family oxidoreductase n=1 Tax=Propionicimonas sp. TaxID=1955623 RepID=UPI003D11E655